MIAIQRTKYGIRFHDVIFSPNPFDPGCHFHLARFSQSAKAAYGFTPCATKIVDLSVDQGLLFSSLSNSTRYKIRRAEREGMNPLANPTPELNHLNDFCAYYDIFAASKQLPASNREKLIRLQEQSSLLLTSVHDSQDRTVVAHAYIADRESERIRLLYSASHFRSSSDTQERNRIGHANRLLHWHSMLSARSLGYRRYDLGGFPLTQTNAEKVAIAKFKAEFGGEIVVEFNGLLSRNRLLQRTLPAVQRIFT
ncbi:MAG: hypothetical protein ACK5GN_02565 [Pseudomonadota bacterium]|jgi:hypothetical protein